MRWKLYRVKRMSERIASIAKAPVSSTFDASSTYYEVKIGKVNPYVSAVTSYHGFYRIVQNFICLKKQPRDISNNGRSSFGIGEMAACLDFSRRYSHLSKERLKLILITVP